MKHLVLAALSAAALLAGCAEQPAGHRAPIVDHSLPAGAQATPLRSDPGKAEPARNDANSASKAEERAQPDDRAGTMEKDWRPQVYTVQPGDTLYGIAFNFGLDYHELAEINNIPDPTLIHPGQQLQLFAAPGTVTGAASSVQASPIKEQPLAVKLPYSEQALAQLEHSQPVQAGTGAKAGGALAASRNGKDPGVVVAAGIAPGGVPVKWEMPTSGKLIAGFSEAENRKGVDIAGKQGQPIYASAPGKVIFCGSGLRGYGKLVIIKHDATYLSAYAHNDKLLVKEGQMVSKGQMIAQMGKTDADRVALHFEIRKFGKPVDPAKYLVFPKS